MVSGGGSGAATAPTKIPFLFSGSPFCIVLYFNMQGYFRFQFCHLFLFLYNILQKKHRCRYSYSNNRQTENYLVAVAPRELPFHGIFSHQIK